MKALGLPGRDEEELDMRMATRRFAAGLAVAALMAAAAAPAMAQDDDWPNSGTLNDGSTFTLAPRIAEKIANGEPINYLFSYQSSAIQSFSPQYQAGYEEGQILAQDIYPVNGTIIAPPAGQTDVPLQLSQIQAQLDTGQVDCLSIEPATADGFTQITNDVLVQGIPVFTVGTTSNGNEFTNFTQIPMLEGIQSANVVLDWMEATGNDLKVFAVSGGDTSQFWAQGRMQGFYDTINEAIPDAVFVTEPSTVASTSYDSPTTFDWYTALINGNPELQFIQNVDIGADEANDAIIRGGNEDKIFTIGWNVTLPTLDYIDQGIQAATLDQRWSEQAGFGAQACADFLANGVIRPNSQELLVINQENSAQAREDQLRIEAIGAE